MLKKIRHGWKKLGPGLITASSDDDPSGIATYSQAGAQFGLQTLWTALLTLPLMIALMEMFARLSLITKRGLTENIIRYYSPSLLYVVIFITVPAIVFNIGANIAAIGAVSNLLFPEISNLFFSVFFTILLAVCMLFFSYKKIEIILKWLCLALFIYIIVPFLVEQDWKSVLKATFIPQIQLNKEYIYILVAILGTTISPYLFFWQGIMSLENKFHVHSQRTLLNETKETRFDINLGMILSNLVMFFIILTCASVLYPAGITQIDTADQAAAALKPLAGNQASWLFALGIVGTGLLSIPVLSGCLAYIMSEVFEWNRGIDKKWHQAHRFYLVLLCSLLLGLLLSILNFNPFRLLIYTAVAYGLTCPILIFLALLMCNRKDILGNHTNGWLSNVCGSIALLITTTSAIALIIMLF